MSTPYGSSPQDPGNGYGAGQDYGSAPRYGQYGSTPDSGYGSTPDYSAQPYGQPVASPGYDQTYPQAGYSVPPRPRNTLALVSMILSLVGLVTWITAIGGIVCGHIARKQIRQTGEEGDGMALTGIIVGYVVAIGGFIFFVGYVILVVWLATLDPSYDSYSLLGVF